jgi:hypothetical protein
MGAQVTEKPVQSTRDRGFTALVEGFFANCWFGWGHAVASDAVALWLNIGGATAVVVALIGAVIGFRSPKATGAVSNRAAGIRYGIIVGVEFTIAGAGAGLLGAFGQTDYIPPWICAVVGIHFFALVSLLRDRMLIPLGILMCVVAGVATVAGLTDRAAPSTVTGLGAGGLLLLFGVLALLGIRRPAPSAASRG